MSDGERTPRHVDGRDGQITLFDVAPDWAELWKGMPAFEHEDLTPMQTVMVHLFSVEDRRALASLLGQTITAETKSLWYPKRGGAPSAHLYTSDDRTLPRYPIYVISTSKRRLIRSTAAVDRDKMRSCGPRQELLQIDLGQDVIGGSPVGD